MGTFKAREYLINMDIGKTLAQNFKAIRIRHAGTQEKFEEKVGLKQGRISELENAKGWAQISNLGERLQQAGIDPAELLQPPAHQVTPEAAEVLDLFEAADTQTRVAILTLLRASDARKSRAAS